MLRFPLLSLSFFLLLPVSFANQNKEDLHLDPRVQQFAQDLMQKHYSYEKAFDTAISEAYQCLSGNAHPNSRICQTYGFWK